MKSSRYSRQELFAGVGRQGQERLRAAHVTVLGCGALGSALCETLVRAGVGALTVVDRDLVEESNLQRQSLFDEDDARRGLPKAVAAEARLRRLNSDVRVEGVVADACADNLAGFVEGRALLLDGSDNFELRYALNDACLRAGVPWIYGACVGSYGLALSVRPGRTPCLRCVQGDRPAPGSAATCDTAGVIAPIVQVLAGVQAAEALKLLCGREEALLPGLVTIDLWAGTFDVLDLSERAPSCPACTRARYDYLDESAVPAASLCGRDAVQVRAPRGARVDLADLERRLTGLGQVRANAHLLRFSAPEAELVVFADGRALVKGVQSPAQARSLYARYVGH
jgi:adenylyltransferase/sulfurtransferase